MSLLEELVFGKQAPTLTHKEVAEEPPKKLEPAWVDPDDATLSIPSRKANILGNEEDEVNGSVFQQELTNRFERATEHIDTTWADLDKCSGEVFDATRVFTNSGEVLSSDRLIIVRRSDLPKCKDKGGIKRICFSPVAAVCAYIGNKGTLCFASYTNEKSSLLYDIPSQGRYRYNLCYSLDGSRVFVGCSDGRFQSVDSNGTNVFDNIIPGCKDDVVAIDCSEKLLGLVTRKSAHFFNVTNLAYRGTVETSEEQLMCGKFSDDGNFFVIAGSRGRGHVIDCSGKKIKSVAVFQHNEQQTIRSLDFSRDLVAMGTEAGILVVFNFDSLRISPTPGKLIYPKPLYTKLNLTTYVDTVRFNPSGELLVFGSSGKVDSLKVLNVASGKVYTNWPTQHTPLKFVTDAAFAGNGTHLALTNTRGATMWELPYYSKQSEK